MATLVRQRIFQVACGYVDQDDADSLRTDPLLKLACGRLPASGADLASQPTFSRLASQPTFSRLENAVNRQAIEWLATALVSIYLRQRGQADAPEHVLLDLDGMDDPAHGHQQGMATTASTASRRSPGGERTRGAWGANTGRTRRARVGRYTTRGELIPQVSTDALAREREATRGNAGEREGDGDANAAHLRGRH